MKMLCVRTCCVFVYLRILFCTLRINLHHLFFFCLFVCFCFPFLLVCCFLQENCGREFRVVLLDSEGIDAAMAKGRTDNQIYILTVLLDSIFIYNSKNVPKRSDLSGLEYPFYSDISWALLFAQLTGLYYCSHRKLYSCMSFYY